MPLPRFHEVFRVSPKLITIVMEYCDDGDIADKVARRKFVHQFFEEEQVRSYIIFALTHVNFCLFIGMCA
jgi:hypothetical protein